MSVYAVTTPASTTATVSRAAATADARRGAALAQAIYTCTIGGTLLPALAELAAWLPSAPSERAVFRQLAGATHRDATARLVAVHAPMITLDIAQLLLERAPVTAELLILRPGVDPLARQAVLLWAAHHLKDGERHATRRYALTTLTTAASLGLLVSGRGPVYVLLRYLTYKDTTRGRWLKNQVATLLASVPAVADEILAGAIEHLPMPEDRRGLLQHPSVGPVTWRAVARKERAWHVVAVLAETPAARRLPEVWERLVQEFRNDLVAILTTTWQTAEGPTLAAAVCDLIRARPDAVPPLLAGRDLTMLVPADALLPLFSDADLAVRETALDVLAHLAPAASQATLA